LEIQVRDKMSKETNYRRLDYGFNEEAWFSMKIGEVLCIYDSYRKLYRVPGGWVFQNVEELHDGVTSVFIPLPSVP
jgi:hypothetical protein